MPSMFGRLSGGSHLQVPEIDFMIFRSSIKPILSHLKPTPARPVENEVADYFAISVGTVYRLIDEGNLKRTKNRGILESVYSLYLDKPTEKPKRGSLMKNSPGTLYRFVDVAQQLDLAYDLSSMTGEQILQLLPNEFDR